MEIVKTASFEVAVNTKGDKNSPKLAILMPGRLDTKDYANFVSHTNFLANQGFYAVAIDPPGTWDSPGSLDNYTTSTYLQTIHELIKTFGDRPTLLLGHSRGGATAMLATTNQAVAGLVVVNAAYGNPSAPEPEKITNGTLLETRDLPPGDRQTEEQKTFNLPMAYFEDGPKHNPKAALINYQGPKLIVHATKDEFIIIERVRDIFEALSEPKVFLEIDCTHDYRLYPGAIQQVENALKDFIDKHLQ